MNKEAADKCIYEYRDKIFGFAMKQTRNVDQANELASDILCEVYRSFRRADAIANLDGYVYRIAQNVWARYARSLVESRRLVSIDGAAIPYEAEPDTDEREMFEKLRREIGYLSERQRQVVYLHYYRECSVSEIAARLKIAARTVKWHLSDARIKLKEGITMTNSEQTLGINPIRFVVMGHWGNPGATGDTSHMFDTRLKQNIAYACYWQPKTLEEIARELGVPQVYLADDLKKLVDYAYVDQLDNTKNPKYQTNMMIEDMRKGSPTDDLMDGAAKYLCERYFPDVFRQFEADPEHWGFVCDGNDVNFMKYTLLMLCLIFFRSLTKKVDSSVFHVKRPDGGNFIATAWAWEDVAAVGGANPYGACGYMSRWQEDASSAKREKFYALSVNCRYTDRRGDWGNNLTSDWQALTRFRSGGKEALAPEEYKRLCDMGYLYEDRVQPMVFRTEAPDSSSSNGMCLSDSLMRLLGSKLPVTDELRGFSQKLDREIFARRKNAYPERMHRAVKLLFCTDQLGDPELIPRCIEKLLAGGLLQPLTDVQRKAVLAVLCVEE